jgi:RNA polymerase sigma factor (sigma-70 family)
MSTARDFETLVRQHQGAVCAVAFSVLRDRARSEEVAQDAFLIAWQKLPALAEPPTLPAWICGIARNLARNAARRTKETAMDAEPIATRTPLDAVLDHEADDIAARALAALAEPDREVVVLYYRGDGSVAEVAAALGITEPAARQRLHRGRERLKSAAAAVEASLRATRPGAAFTAGCVAALAAGVVPSAADAATAGSPVAQSPSAVGPAAIVGGVLALLGIGVAIAVYVSRNASEHTAGAASTSRPASGPSASRPDANSPATAGVVRRIDAAARTTLVDAITAARRQRATQVPTGEPETKIYDFSGAVLDDLRELPPPKPGPLSKATIRYAIQEIQPMLLECYTEAAPRLARKDGTIGVTMRLVGEPDIGTLVESVALDGDAHLLADASLSECMRETLMTLELPAMAGSETWDVLYPFVVR